MKCVMISIRPEWCEKIVNGSKTIEVRKNAPKEVPFKAYIYCTRAKILWRYSSYEGAYENSNGEVVYAQQHVIGEFICDRIDELCYNYPFGYVYTHKAIRDMCLSAKEIEDYGKGKTLYGWHISDLKIYDKPKELSEFNRPCVSPTRDCEKCVSGGTPYTWDFDEDTGKIYCTRRVKTPPQSWFYVEEL